MARTNSKKTLYSLTQYFFLDLVATPSIFLRGGQYSPSVCLTPSLCLLESELFSMYHAVRIHTWYVQATPECLVMFVPAVGPRHIYLSVHGYLHNFMLVNRNMRCQSVGHIMSARLLASVCDRPSFSGSRPRAS